MSNLIYCRLCGLELPLPCIKTLEQIKDENLDTVIYQCLHINLNLNDVFPKTTCYNCCNAVLEYHNFLNKVQNVQLKLREIFIENALNIKTETNDDETRNFVYEPLFSYMDNKASKKTENSTATNKSPFPFNEVKSEDNDSSNEIVISEPTDLKEETSIKKEENRTETSKQCSKCDFYCESATDLEEHIESFHDDWVFSESESKESKPSKKSLSKTKRQKKALVKYDCEKCGKSFKQKSHLQRHHFTHVEDKPIKCDECGKRFKHPEGLKEHSRKHLPPQENNQYKCDVCNKMLISANGLLYHKKMHEGTYEYICEVCGAKCRTQQNLAGHRLMHQTETPFNCEICTKAFKTEYGLKKHQLVHSDVKPHVCDVCGQKFKEKRGLVRHHNSHSKELPFECSYCKKCFREKRFLQVHLRQHTGERPYSCKECNHHFTNSSNYIKHMRGRHGNYKPIKNVIILRNAVDS
ncbi:zinc finger protein 501-like isoform X3 [Chrysoperla carnea]|uniref:zinc finger protein 501-like isoform X3 n=1 Tax=Chrysoperla carnea TaxID=189513 RepID=UPI001D07C560|nr:zinc finger protein 501-like isoform X3 [Chrysoperla carnea]